MAIEIKRKPNESLSVFLRRFSERVKRSGIINQYKRARFHLKPESRRLRKRAALRRNKDREKMGYLRKIGKIK